MGAGMLGMSASVEPRQSARRRPRILLVEDDPAIARMYQTGLGMAGYDVVLAADGAEGLVQIRQFRPDLVLLDLRMPVMDGMEVLEHLRADPNLSATKVAVLTNYSEHRTRQAALSRGAIAFVIKLHVTPRELAQNVARWLAGDNPERG